MAQRGSRQLLWIVAVNGAEKSICVKNLQQFPTDRMSFPTYLYKSGPYSQTFVSCGLSSLVLIAVFH